MTEHLLLRSVVFRNKGTTDWTEKKQQHQSGGVKRRAGQGQELEEFIIKIVLRTLYRSSQRCYLM